MSATTVATHETNSNHVSETPELRLFSPHQIAAATFVGGSAAGALLADNFYRLGKTTAAVLAAIGGIALTVLAVALAMQLPENVPGMAFVLVQTFLMFGVTKATLGETYARHIASGGKTGSGLRAIGITLGTLVVSMGIVIAIFA